MSDDKCTQPEIRKLDSEAQFRDAWRALLALGFVEQSAIAAGEFRSCLMLAPDGYAVRLVYEPRGRAAS